MIEMKTLEERIEILNSIVKHLNLQLGDKIEALKE